MEAFAMYLIKSVIWLSGFILVFFLFLRNERFFFLNRLYLIAGILTSLLFPFVSVRYTVILPIVQNLPAGELSSANGIQNNVSGSGNDIGTWLSGLYLAGIVFVLFTLIRQSKSLIKTIKKAQINKMQSAKLIRTAEYPASFSFFSYVFVNPSITDIETVEIVNHEMVHIRQWHWFDLVLAELLCVLQWFNPLAWIYFRFVRQNHEYLADEVALQQSSDPALYRAALLNQIVGYPVVSLANSFNYSPSKKRFNMMKNIISSPYRKLKIFLILPVFAIVLFAFAKPEYKYSYIDEKAGINDQVSGSQEKEIKGTVLQQNNGQPLEGAVILVMGTTQGVTTDSKGSFKLGNVPEEAKLAVTFVGFKSMVVKPVFKTDMIIKMVRDTMYIDMDISTPPSPPPPPPPPSQVNDIENIKAPSPLPGLPPLAPLPERGADQDSLQVRMQTTGSESFQFRLDEPPPLFLVNGVITDASTVSKIKPEAIQSVTVLKNSSATKLYGETGKNGVVKIYTVNPVPSAEVKIEAEAKPVVSVTDQKPEKDVFVVVEELPEFPGGRDALAAWITSNIRYPVDAAKSKITGKVLVDFTVTNAGKVKHVQVTKSVQPLLDAEAIRVISAMPDWKPGTQSGKPVEVSMVLPVEFKLQ